MFLLGFREKSRTVQTRRTAREERATQMSTP